MELHSRRSSTIGKRLWNFLRVTFFMMRKGLISKKKLIMDLNLFFKRGKLIRRSLHNLISHHHHNHNHLIAKRGASALRECEFSCSNSPNPLFFDGPSWKRKHSHHIHLPCMDSPHVQDEIEAHDVDQRSNALVLVPKTPEYTFSICLDGYDLAPEEQSSPCNSTYPMKICDYSSEEDMSEAANTQVDHEAEEFIKNFYEQLRAQSRVQLLQY